MVEFITGYGSIFSYVPLGFTVEETLIEAFGIRAVNMIKDKDFRMLLNQKPFERKDFMKQFKELSEYLHQYGENKYVGITLFGGCTSEMVVP